MGIQEADVTLNVVQLRRIFCSTVDSQESVAQAALAEEGVVLTTEEVVAQAQFIRESSRHHCFFCNAPNSHQTGWLEMTWPELSHVVCACLAQYRGTRKVHFTNWEKRLPEIVKKMHSGMLPETTPLYTDLCAEASCRKAFVVTAKKIGRAHV